jgi:hypothetical protein
MERSNLILQLFELDDPSKIIFTLTRGIINLISLALHGKYSNIYSWIDIKREFSQHKMILK